MDIDKHIDFSNKCKNKSFDIEELKDIIDKDSSIIHGMDNGPLGYLRPALSAISVGNLAAFKILVESGIDINRRYYIEGQIFRNVAGYNCLNYACVIGEIEIVKFLYPYNLKLRNCLCDAASFGHTDIVQFFFDTLAYDNESFKKHEYVFSEAFENLCCYYENRFDDDPIITNISDVIRLFIRNIDERKLDYSELFFTQGIVHAFGGLDLDTLLLIFTKCNPNIVFDEYVFSDNLIIYHLLCYQRYDFLDSTLDYFDYNLKGTDGNTPLIHICINMPVDFSEEHFKKILERSDPNIENNMGNTAIYYLKKNNLQKFIDIMENN